MLSDDLDDFLANDGVGINRSSATSFSGSDEFDPAALLSQPLFDDEADELNLSKHAFVDMHDGIPEHVHVTTESGPDSSQSHNAYGHAANFSMQQQQQQQQVLFQLQQQQQMASLSGNETAFEPNSLEYPSQGPFLAFDQQDVGHQAGMGMNNVHNQQHEVNKRMLEVQQKIQQVEQQIQNVQLGGPPPSVHLENQDPQVLEHQSMLQHEGFLGMAGAQQGNMSSFTRSPPGRSISMPAQRLRMSPASPFTNSFVMQQQQQQQNALQAMSESLNSAYTEPGIGQRHQMMSDASTRSVPAQMGTDSGMSRLALMQQATMQGVGHPPLTSQLGGNGPVARNNSLPRMGNNSLPPVGLPQSISMVMPVDTGEVGGMAGGSFDVAAMAQGFAASNQQSGGDQPPSNVNEAMEKLCESMRRSAMSRSLVKQFSGRSLTRSHSGHGLSRSNSGRMTKNLSGRNLGRNNSGRQLSGANSGRSLQRTHSGRQVPVDTPELQPVRRMSQDTKHRLTPTRGVFRNHSTTAIMGAQKMENMAGMLQMQQQDMMQMQQMPQQMHAFEQQGGLPMIDPSSMQQMEDGQLPNFFPQL
jgi:hypothetical protein